MNLGIFKGNLTRDCEVRKIPSGTAVCGFTIAVNSGFGDKEHTDYVDCAIFGKRAEGKLVDYLTKGTQVLVSGNLKLVVREHDGKTFANMKLAVQELDLVGTKTPQNPTTEQSAPKPPSQGAPGNPVTDQFADDIPF